MDGAAMNLETVLARHAIAAGGDGRVVRDAIAGLAGCLNGRGDAAFELSELAGRFASLLRVAGETRPDLVLRDLAGDELVLTAGLAAIGQRAGYRVDVVLGETRVGLAHYDAVEPLVLSARDGWRVVDPRGWDEPLRWASPREVDATLTVTVTPQG